MCEERELVVCKIYRRLDHISSSVIESTIFTYITNVKRSTRDLQDGTGIGGFNWRPTDNAVSDYRNGSGKQKQRQWQSTLGHVTNTERIR